ncbi:MAG: EAL domain-containing protein [Ruminococcus sp.]|nr:EAL domain-containing protein [Ruminococcus sp.]MBR1764442.1 EAL domain-containing protein [Ruminococcus sp.]
MADAITRKKKRKKYLKLGKNRWWLSILLFLLVSAVSALLLLFFVGTVLFFTVDTGIVNEYEEKQVLIRLAKRGLAGESDPYAVFDEAGMTYFIKDKDGNIVHSFGENTCGESGETYFLDLDSLMDENGESVLDDKGEPVASEKSTSIILHPDTEDPVLAGDDGGGISIGFQELLKRTFKIFYNTAGEDTLDESVRMELPIWEELELEDGSRLFFRAVISLKDTDLVLFVLMFLSAALIFAIVFIIMIINAITSAVHQRKVNKLFFTDMQTKGRNWMWFIFRSEQTLRKIRNAKKTYALIDLELTGYRRYCICHSLDDGEARLTETHQALNTMVTKKELCAHSAEDRFALLLNYTDVDALDKRINAMLSGLGSVGGAHSFVFHAGVFLIEKSRGGGLFGRRKYVDIESDYNNACNARATLDSRSESAAAWFDDKLVEDQRWEDTVTELQQRALANEEFIVYYQPKYDPRTGELRGAEALIRWQSPEYGFITPYKFIPIFEKNGFITEIDHYMISHVARDQRRWLDMGYKCVPVSVNVSRAHFIEPDLAEQIRDMIDNYGTPHELIEIELTESAFFDDKNAMIHTITKLKEYGFAVSMDDFGSGYSSLNSLKDMPLDVLKLDAEFFRGEAAGTDRGEIVVSEAIKLAKSLNMRTVAEGVEIKDQVDFLATQGCDMIQGYYFAKPMPGSEYEEKMKNGKADAAVGEA